MKLPNGETMMDDNTQEIRAFSFNGALEAGYNPRDYPWQDLPVGTFQAVLDFKMWGNKCLGCFFTNSENIKFKVNAFTPRGENYIYTPKDGIFDMSKPGLEGTKFTLTITKSAKGTLEWSSAELAD